METGVQDYIVWAVVAAAVAVTIVRFWRLLCGRRRGGCASCGNTKCPLKEIHRK